MKKRIICWGKNEAADRCFYAFELQVKENTVQGHIIPATVLTQEFENLLANQWRNGGEVQFPEGAVGFNVPLTVTESVVPEGHEVDNPSLIRRSQSEWNFMVMSQKLADLYHQEVDDFKDKIDNLKAFDSPVWEGLKTFWGKVNDQIKEKNLLRGHGHELRDKTNALFEQMKDLRKKMDQEFREISDKNKEGISEVMDKIEAKIESGLSLKPVFNELKKVQNDLKKMDLTKGHRRKLWDRIDKAFKNVKAKRFGDNPERPEGAKSRLQHRYDGLLEVIGRMERSIQRDRNDLEFQNKRINTTDGQLEAQIRKAKTQMIDERILSKTEKLNDMLKTKTDLEGRLVKEKAREEERAAKKAEREKVDAAKAKIEEKIAAEMTEAKDDRKEELDKLLQAADKINLSRQAKKDAQKKKEQSEKAPLGDGELTITEFVSDQLEDIVDTAKAVASIVGSKISEVVEELTGEEE